MYGVRETLPVSLGYDLHPAQTRFLRSRIKYTIRTQVKICIDSPPGGYRQSYKSVQLKA